MTTKKLLVLNNALLFLCVSMYLGTGWSLILFSFPIAPQLTIDNYYMQFVPQVTAATHFFTWMTGLMVLLAVIMIVAEWRSRMRWAPVVVLVGVLAATGLTLRFILPYNAAMSDGITDPVQLQEVLGRWMMLNRIRVGVWTVQWSAMMIFFAVRNYEREVFHAERPATGAGADLRRDSNDRAGAAAGA